MSDIIRLLPDSVANQIAAGEVIQRPASAVKELLENAIDAGADSITLIIKDAGRTLVQVIDNGSGMSVTDARLCWERHATSKIKSSDDLFAIKTMGFRGEALASIAAVSQVEMKTRRPQDDIGVSIQIEASQVIKQEFVHCNVGTSISMKNLFFNVPVRRNFLKSNPVEYTHILEEFYRVALANPAITFSLINNNAEVIKVKSGNLRQRVVGLFGMDYNERLIPIEEQTSIVHISGFVCKPEFARKKRGEQYFFVNGRFIKSSFLNHAIVSAYKDLLPDQLHPGYFVFLEMDPKQVDINIHPTKTEIKFEDEKSIYAILRSATQRSIGRFNVSPTIDFDQEAVLSFLPTSKMEGPLTAPAITVNPDFNPFHTQTSRTRQMEMPLIERNSAKNWESLYQGFENRNSKLDELPIQTESVNLNSGVFFQVNDTYIISRVKSGLIIIDQHLAHQRILVERLETMLNNHSGVSQKLMFPVLINLAAADAVLVSEMIPALNALGIELHTVDNLNFQITAVAPYMQESDLEELMDVLLEEYKASSTLESKQRALISKIAVRTAIKRGQTLQLSEMEALVNDLFACSQPQISANGKPTYIRLETAEISKRFE